MLSTWLYLKCDMYLAASATHDEWNDAKSTKFFPFFFSCFLFWFFSLVLHHPHLLHSILFCLNLFSVAFVFIHFFSNKNYITRWQPNEWTRRNGCKKNIINKHKQIQTQNNKQKKDKIKLNQKHIIHNKTLKTGTSNWEQAKEKCEIAKMTQKSGRQKHCFIQAFKQNSFDTNDTDF